MAASSTARSENVRTIIFEHYPFKLEKDFAYWANSWPVSQPCAACVGKCHLDIYRHMCQATGPDLSCCIRCKHDGQDCLPVPRLLLGAAQFIWNTTFYIREYVEHVAGQNLSFVAEMSANEKLVVSRAMEYLKEASLAFRRVVAPLSDEEKDVMERLYSEMDGLSVDDMQIAPLAATLAGPGKEAYPNRSRSDTDALLEDLLDALDCLSQWKHHGYNRRTEARWLRQWRDPPFYGESPIQKDVPYRAAFNQAVTKGDSPVRPPRARPIWDGQLKKREVKLRPACELDGPMMHPIATAYSPSGEAVGYIADAYTGVGDSWV